METNLTGKKNQAGLSLANIDWHAPIRTVQKQCTCIKKVSIYTSI